MIVIVFGLPGSGKSYFASRFATLINAEYINSDRVRTQVLDEKTYSSKEKSSIYQEMLLQMREVLQKGKNLVLDATFYKNEIRKDFILEGASKGEIRFIEITCGESLTRERLKKSRLDSDADFEVYKIIEQQWDIMHEPHLILQSTNDNLAEMLLKTTDYLHLEDDKRTNT